MTKQEQIEEISNIIAEVAFVQAHEENGDENLSDIVATALYNAGYRKSEEVRKETAKEFAEKLKIKAIRLSEIENYHVCNLIDELLKERQK